MLLQNNIKTRIDAANLKICSNPKTVGIVKLNNQYQARSTTKRRRDYRPDGLFKQVISVN